MKNENSKIQIPNVDSGYTPRSADSLLSSTEADIVLLTAGAGYGKTQMLANYVHHFPGKSAWYSMSDTDNDLISFIQNFTNSVQNAMKNCCDSFRISVPLPENIDILMEQLVVWLDARIDFLNVVFDDFQEISNPDIFNLLDILIETMDKKIRLFIVEKRSLPCFFDKYTNTGRAVCIGMEELKFQPEEIAILLKDMGENAGQWAQLIFNCTEGWPVGIAQIMLQLRQQKNTTIDILKDICDNLDISDYFMTRVYKMLPFDIQTFLKKTAVLDYMTPAICNKITGIYNSDSMLRYLVNERLFVQTLGESSSLYRYHSVFQRFLLSQTSLEDQQDILRTVSYFLLQTNDKIQAAEYACRGKAADIVQAVIEVSGDSMLEDRLYGTLERWFTFLNTEHCELTSKARFIYGKYLMILGHTPEANQQIEQAGKDFYKEGRLQEYKKVLLFLAAAKRRAGELKQAEMFLAQAEAYPEPFWNETAQAVCAEQVKIKCCLQQLQDAAQLLLTQINKGVQFQKNSFLWAALQVLNALNQQPQPSFTVEDIHLSNISEGFLLRNCILAEQMKTAYHSADYQTVRQIAKEIIQNSSYKTLQTAASWEILAVLSWNDGDYRKAMEQSRTGSAFLFKNQIWNLNFTLNHQQILNEIHSIQRNAADTRYLIAPKKQVVIPETKKTGKIKVQCLDCFLVFLPDAGESALKWRTKKAQELFAYLFHLQGNSVSREVLIELLWPEAGCKSAIALFHTTLYSIRQAFLQEGLENLICYEKKNIPSICSL